MLRTVWQLSHIDHIIGDMLWLLKYRVGQCYHDIKGQFVHTMFISLSLTNHISSSNSKLTELSELYAFLRMLCRVALFCKNNFVLY